MNCFTDCIDKLKMIENSDLLYMCNKKAGLIRSDSRNSCVNCIAVGDSFQLLRFILFSRKRILGSESDRYRSTILAKTNTGSE